MGELAQLTLMCPSMAKSTQGPRMGSKCICTQMQVWCERLKGVVNLESISFQCTFICGCICYTKQQCNILFFPQLLSTDNQIDSGFTARALDKIHHIQCRIPITNCLRAHRQTFRGCSWRCIHSIYQHDHHTGPRIFQRNQHNSRLG